MVRLKLRQRDLTYLKPEGREDWLTLTELSRAVNRDPRWLRKLEKNKRIPEAYRIQQGQLLVRLWSPEQVSEISEIISNMRRGRPRNA